jgi:Ala-tRNA(Pro) deacylase
MDAVHRIERYLDENKIPFELITHPHTATSLETAKSAGVDARRVAKAVLLEADECYMAAMIPADEDIRLGQLREDYGKDFRLAEEATIRELFQGCDPGAVPGMPSAWGVEMVWDDDLLAEPDLYLEAGDHERLIHVETRHLRDLLQETPHCHFSKPRRSH